MNTLTTKSVLLFGASGLVGSELLKQLLVDLTVLNITVFSRKPLTIENEKVRVVITDFSNLNSLAHYFTGCTVLYCCLGTTLRKAGSKEAFRAVDYDMVLTIASIASQQNVKKFIAISSLGADAGSSNFYLRTKGEMERDVSMLKFQKIAFLRPSFLLGDRNEFRLGEKAMIAGMVLLKPFFRGRLVKYKPIESAAVAKAMINISNSLNNNRVYESGELLWLSK